MVRWFLVAGALLAFPALAEKRVVPVPEGNVEALAAAVNDPNNANTVVQLAPGTYVLTGHLVLQQGMDLVGANRYVDSDGDGVWDALDEPSMETVIDASTAAFSALTSPMIDCAGAHSFPNDSPIAIIVGLGNRVANLTVKSAANGIPVGGDLPAPGQTAMVAEVSDCILNGGTRAAVFPNGSCAAKGFDSSLVFARNIVRGKNAGISITNIANDRDSKWHAAISYNRFTGINAPAAAATVAV